MTYNFNLIIRYKEDYTDSWIKYQSNHFLYFWWRLRLQFRKHRERM